MDIRARESSENASERLPIPKSTPWNGAETGIIGIELEKLELFPAADSVGDAVPSVPEILAKTTGPRRRPG